jgi:hypothetical protein
MQARTYAQICEVRFMTLLRSRLLGRLKAAPSLP